MVTGALGEGEGKQAPSPEPHHGLRKINTSVKMCSLTRRVLLAQGERKKGGRRRRDVSLPSHSKLAKFSPSVAEEKN